VLLHQEQQTKTNLKNKEKYIMAMTLAEIRAKLQQQEDKKGGNSGSFGDGSVYAHWNINEGDSARIRFLPDADPTNNFFWVERAMIKLPFAGIKGDPNSKPCIVQVPCIEMWPDMGMCPILSEVRPWFKDKSLEEMGRKYWKKKSYLFQGFVRENPIKEEKVPENPIRRLIISPQIFNLIKAALMDPELENLPTDYASGLDFTVLKTSKGGYADYSTSKWSRKESALTADEAEAIEKHGLFNLQDFLPKRPSAEELVIMKEMFEASVDGQAYDGDKWGKFFKPAGFGGNDAPAATGGATPAATPAASEPVEDDDVPVVTAPKAAAAAPKADAATPAAGGSRAEDILAMIRNRQKTA
jgi:hypothetical protein